MTAIENKVKNFVSIHRASVVREFGFAVMHLASYFRRRRHHNYLRYKKML